MDVMAGNTFLLNKILLAYQVVIVTSLKIGLDRHFILLP